VVSSLVVSGLSSGSSPVVIVSPVSVSVSGSVLLNTAVRLMFLSSESNPVNSVSVPVITHFTNSYLLFKSSKYVATGAFAITFDP